MFRASNPQSELDLFNNFVNQMDGTRRKKFNDPQAWHNIFFKYVTSQIDEKLFECLFDKSMGRPNASIRILAGMMILKEGFGWSDTMLFNQCDFNIQVMSALGLTNSNDSVPSEATYYNLRQALYEHQVKEGEDLMGNLFWNLTKEQAKLFGVSGTFTRMDSKLIGSNICKSSRLQLVIRVLQEFYKDIKGREELVMLMESPDKNILDDLLKKKASQIIYTLDKQGRDNTLIELGYLMARILKTYTLGNSEKVGLLLRVFSEQYKIEGDLIVLKDVKELKSDSLQSPYDEDAAYRDKNGQKVQGYSANVTETNNPDGLNLIIDSVVDKANVPDNGFLEESVKRSEEVVRHIGQLNVDGAYHSESNQEFAEKNGTEIILSGLPGNPGKYEFEQKKNGEIEVINTATGEVQTAEKYKEGKYKIKEEGKLKYFTAAVIISFFMRKQVEEIPQALKNMRNNVEATIFQMSYTLRNNKTRYRGQFKNQLWAYCRAMWVNARRIEIYMGELCPDDPKRERMAEFFAKKVKLLTDIAATVKNLCLLFANIWQYSTRWKDFSPCSIISVPFVK